MHANLDQLMKLKCICGKTYQQLIPGSSRAKLNILDCLLHAVYKEFGSHSFNTESVLQRQISGSLFIVYLKLQFP